MVGGGNWPLDQASQESGIPVGQRLCLKGQEMRLPRSDPSNCFKSKYLLSVDLIAHVWQALSCGPHPISQARR